MAETIKIKLFVFCSYFSAFSYNIHLIAGKHPFFNQFLKDQITKMRRKLPLLPCLQYLALQLIDVIDFLCKSSDLFIQTMEFFSYCIILYLISLSSLLN